MSNMGGVLSSVLLLLYTASVMTHEAKGLKTRRLAACESPSISAAKFTEALLRFLSPESVSF